jgi:hypothetical protein
MRLQRRFFPLIVSIDSVRFFFPVRPEFALRFIPVEARSHQTDQLVSASFDSNRERLVAFLLMVSCMLYKVVHGSHGRAFEAKRESGGDETRVENAIDTTQLFGRNPDTDPLENV